ncbi:TonB-dependent receptor [Mucilaginibacter limnophilus]|nr:carboxypeptidase regulatory-like domain-containing protein [Mucilaginibacter limnophilus]
MIICGASFAQVTTSSLTGVIKDAKGETLIGATVKATHTPSGTNYATATNADGKFTLPNMRVGGPYLITVTYVGYNAKNISDIYLKLGEPYSLNLTLESGNVLQDVVITANRNSLMNSDRTGAGTNVSRSTIQAIPTINRGLRDFTKLSPLANVNGSGTSFAGTNNRYNQFSIDGITNNDVFGLAASGTNGGQTNIEPISLDAIEEFQINIAPYDLRQGGFTGGGINAVTRSGTNEYQGSVYYFGNNQSLVGQNNPNTNVKSKYPKYSDYQLGFRVGGPIVKNKLFFFVNGEITRNTTPNAFDPTDPGSGSKVTIDEINRVVNTLKRIAPSYDPGSYGKIDDETNSNKFLVKIDWNINDKHKLTARHSYAFGENIDNSRGNNNLSFYNHGQYFPSTTNSTGVELNSTFNSEFSNNLLLGYTRVRDDRDPLGDPFPEVRINNLSGGGYIYLGSEYSSVANQLDQDIFSINDNFSWYKGKHTFTIGTNNEFYKFYNLFAQNIFGSYAYKTLEDFESIGTAAEVAPTYYAKSYSFDPNDGPYQTNAAARFSAMQLGLYVQDDFQVTDDFKLTYGIRGDLPVFNDNPPFNQDFANAYGSRGLSTSQKPKTTVLWSPRLGFNWDVLGDKSLKVRGGTGIFTGRVPFVWISNQYSNNGTVVAGGTVGNSSSSGNPITNPTGIKFNADPFNQPQDVGGVINRGAINITDKDFKFPQTFRSNIGIDKQLPWGLIGTIEAIYSKGINNVTFENLNREVDASFTFNGADQRPRYYTGRRNSQFDEIIVFGNSNKGYSYNFVAQLQKQFSHGFAGSISYTYGKSTDINSGTSSTAYSNWRYVNAIDPNNVGASYANFDVRHRVSGFVTYRIEYAKNFATQISLFYNGQSGQPVSYIYDGDLNNDGTANDLIFVPANRSQISLTDITNGLTADQQWQKLDSYISNNSYLKDRRGKYAERNGSRLPFQQVFDVRILQDLGMNIGNTKNRLQLSFDILNFGNLLNKNWGSFNTVPNQTFSFIKYTGLATDGKTPNFQYTEAGQTDGKIYSESDLTSRWRAQIGIRYIFN